jgi:hypothetical protein
MARASPAGDVHECLEDEPAVPGVFRTTHTKSLPRLPQEATLGFRSRFDLRPASYFFAAPAGFGGGSSLGGRATSTFTGFGGASTLGGAISTFTGLFIFGGSIFGASTFGASTLAGGFADGETRDTTAEAEGAADVGGAGAVIDSTGDGVTICTGSGRACCTVLAFFSLTSLAFSLRSVVSDAAGADWSAGAPSDGAATGAFARTGLATSASAACLSLGVGALRV